MDRKKVIKNIKSYLSSIQYEREMPADSILFDTLELLKEQEPLAVCEGKVNKCVCGNEINRYWNPEYCGFCGKKLLWY